ncbi:MAG: M20/M25/M40 family metallo-hydrolase, partial [Acidobacteria bacterium]|nr:M20/M25/M40 family metallo-hydrolase [Acidobacteriota bacterium]
NSPAYRQAADWIRARLKQYGIADVRFEEWGPFGPGWECTHFAAHLREPQYAPLLGFPLGWSQGTNGKVEGEPVLLFLATDADFAAWKGKLRGRIVMTEGPRDLPLNSAPPAHRLSPVELADLERPLDPAPPPLVTLPASPDPGAVLRGRINQFLMDEGVALLITAGQRGDFGTIMAKSVPSRAGVPPMPPPTAAIAAEQYNRIARLLLKHIPVKVEFDIRVRVLPAPVSAFNVIAEIPGGAKPGEVVMLGGHLDSWNSGTGATDNGTGVAVVLEAARILKALNLKLDRTVRLGFWAAEEHGLLGSKAYLEAHQAELPRFSCYLNADGGAGRVRGIFLQGNPLAREPFAAWLAPFGDLGAATVSPRAVHGSDHDAFDSVGVPGFQFIQDPLDYFTRTHHSNMDLYDRAPAGDLMQTAAILASLAYHAANRA